MHISRKQSTQRHRKLLCCFTLAFLIVIVHLFLRNKPYISLCVQLSPIQLSSKKRPLAVFLNRFKEWEEFWATNDAMVHINIDLSVMEKIILLKDSLKEKTAKTIEGIQMLPAKYEWMVSTLQKRYGHKSNNRSNIVQNLHDLKAVKNNAEKCLDVLEDINGLVNQMKLSGYNICDTNDPMWTDTISKKFLYNILNNALRNQDEKQTMNMGELLESLELEISGRPTTERRMRVLDRKGLRTFEQNSASTDCV
uniref:DUF148 domain-containing protein n=1 Tax=Heterorhabditis bacteriophora TaxID=37862 RepID=A0A1I7WUK3_HETBA